MRHYNLVPAAIFGAILLCGVMAGLLISARRELWCMQTPTCLHQIVHDEVARGVR